jgi:hypothetical protein
MLAAASVAGRVAVFVLAGGVVGCASTDYHYSQLVGERYHRTAVDTYPVSVVKIDGRDTMLRIRPKVVEPGRRVVSVQGPPGGAGGVGEVRTLAMDVAPCTRYYLVAVKSQKLASDFTVKIDHQEPVSGCTPPKSS